MNRPFVFINVAMTADGKIDTFQRSGSAISSARDRERVDRLRAGADAVMVGGRTLLDEDPKLTVKSEALRAERVEHGLPPNPMKVGVVTEAHLRPDSKFLNTGPASIVIFTTRLSSKNHVSFLRSHGVDIYMDDSDKVNLPRALETLKQIGVERLMVEGGAWQSPSTGRNPERRGSRTSASRYTSPMTSAPRLLVVDPSIVWPEDAGVAEIVGDWPETYRVVRPALEPGSGPKPGDPYDADAIVVMGSRASVNDDLPWLRDLGAWLDPVIAGRRRIPLLGICFAHQLIAHRAGVPVGRIHGDGSEERGVQTTRFSGSRLAPDGPMRVVASHGEEVRRADRDSGCCALLGSSPDMTSSIRSSSAIFPAAPTPSS